VKVPPSQTGAAISPGSTFRLSSYIKSDGNIGDSEKHRSICLLPGLENVIHGILPESQSDLEKRQGGSPLRVSAFNTNGDTTCKGANPFTWTTINPSAPGCVTLNLSSNETVTLYSISVEPLNSADLSIQLYSDFNCNSSLGVPVKTSTQTCLANTKTNDGFGSFEIWEAVPPSSSILIQGASSGGLATSDVIAIVFGVVGTVIALLTLWVAVVSINFGKDNPGHSFFSRRYLHYLFRRAKGQKEMTKIEDSDQFLRHHSSYKSGNSEMNC
jgi:hypothetical protein